ncbi:hypothetical protein [Pelotomaculum propionicicum]|uniref:Uncharacterized protein n=1 Tax=Pelotomaculum propionicicum TaxID=258475 RepID=A0A4Y7RU42_9FIRM|nr:hypothetical protein [Pelotomaculum propionicicum]TEB12393.1 hypothetical protein Pmgp_01010 [Pelotomaculum propionicicum]
MEHLTNISDALSAFHSDLNRIQTVAGTLAQVERQHYDDLTKYDDERLTRIAVAEQSSSRQLGEIKQLCIAMAQKIEEIQQSTARK